MVFKKRPKSSLDHEKSTVLLPHPLKECDEASALVWVEDILGDLSKRAFGLHDNDSAVSVYHALFIRKQVVRCCQVPPLGLHEAAAGLLSLGRLREVGDLHRRRERQRSLLPVVDSYADVHWQVRG